MAEGSNYREAFLYEANISKFDKPLILSFEAFGSDYDAAQLAQMI